MKMGASAGARTTRLVVKIPGKNVGEDGSFISCVVQYKTRTMKMGRCKFLKSIAFAGAMAAMGFSGCISSPEPTPAPTPAPTPKLPASEPTPKSKQPTQTTFFDVGTELKQCPACGVMMYLRDVYGVLFWVCQNVTECGWMEKVTEPDILKKYGYTDQLKSI